jgi:hypothetical protein
MSRVQKVFIQPPSPQPPNSDIPVFRVANLNFATFLLVANKLQDLRAELSPTNSTLAELVFLDPDDVGPDLLRRFGVGAVEPINPKVLFEARGYLVSEMRRVQNKAMLAAVDDDQPQ